MAETKSQKNPLNQAFGMVLRKARESRSWSYQEIENKSGLKASYIQQVEKGQFNLHVSNCFTLFQTFKVDVPAHGIFSLEGLMQLLSIISVLEARGRENKTYLTGIKSAARNLSDSDFKMEKLFEKFFTHKVFDAKSSEKAAEIISNTNIVGVVEEFLINYKTFGYSETSLQDSYPQTFFKDIPTDKIDLFEKIKEYVLSQPTSYDYRMSWDWEKKNRQLFKNCFILDKNPDLLTGYENLSSYQYDYLWEKGFEKVRILLVSETSADVWLTKFKTNLKKSLNDAKKQSHLSSFETAIKKLEIKCITSEQQITIAESIINPDDENKYNATWVFSLSNNFNVGVRAFINNSDARLSIGDYLKFAETLKMMKEFLNLWDSI